MKPLQLIKTYLEEHLEKDKYTLYYLNNLKNTLGIMLTSHAKEKEHPALVSLAKRCYIWQDNKNPHIIHGYQNLMVDLHNQNSLETILEYVKNYDLTGMDISRLI